jgi:hypothetical protein
MPLSLHTEDAFYSFRADYVGLFCIRNGNGAVTYLAPCPIDNLSPSDVDELFRAQYFFRPDLSHISQSALSGAFIDQPAAVLFGSRSSPYLRVDPDFMNIESSPPRAVQALTTLQVALNANIETITLSAGDALFVDNCRAVHGRSSFVAKYNGTDRWLLRTNIARDLRKMKHVLLCSPNILDG